ncbi:MAG: FHA domain-containing protein [Anaerolineae bacterium]|nr:MAG: FHA domain-containing protein [Anaerolineae bacterium]
MSQETLIFALRILLSLILYAFLALAFWAIWRDLQATRARAEAQARGRPALVVVAPGETDLLPGDRLPLLPVTTQGRALTNTIVLVDSFASAEHARLTQRDGRWWLTDLNSRNGTFLNEVRLQPDEPAPVTEGDLLGVGSVRLRIRL